MCFPLLLFSIPLKNMFYNYLIFSMVALSLRIFKKYFVSRRETCVYKNEGCIYIIGTFVYSLFQVKGNFSLRGT